MKQIKTKAIILRRINYGEADRILTVLTPDHGKVSLLAKGVRKSKSKLAGGLELFTTSNVVFIDGKSDLKIVTSTMLDRNFGHILSDINTTMVAYDFLKLIDSSTKESCEPEYYELLKAALTAIDADTESIELIRAWFSVQILGLKGVAINLDKQSSGKDYEESRNYQFDYDEMAFYASDNGEYDPKHIKFLRLLTKVSKPENLIKISDAHEFASSINPLLNHCLRVG